jgi:hypothetical protein
MSDYYRRFLQGLPGVEEVWDTSLPDAVNINRLITGETASPPFPPPPSTSIREERQEPPTRKQSHDDVSVAEFEEIARSLRRPAPENLQSPLHALQQQVARMFQHGPQRAGAMFDNMKDAAAWSITTIPTPDRDPDEPYLWNSCKAAATLVGILACPAERLLEVALFQARGVLTLDAINSTPSTSLRTAFGKAKVLAGGETRISTVLVVSLVDVRIFEKAKKGESQGYTSFAHTFVLGIGPEGVIIWQAWGEHGYRLDQWINNDGARLRSWREADAFVDDFEKFVSYEVSRLHKPPIRAQANKTTNPIRRANRTQSGTNFTRSASTSTSSRSVEVRGHRDRLSPKRTRGCGS